VVIACIAYDEVLASLWTLWTSHPPYDHGLLVLAICGFMAYRNWSDARPAQLPSAAPAFALLVLPCSILWAFGYLTQTTTAQEVGFVALLGAMLTAILGLPAARAFGVPLALVVFTLPVWDPLVAPLQSVNTLLVTAMLNATAVPAVAEGTDISVPAGTFTVWPACVGLAQIIVGGTIGIVFSNLARLPRALACAVVLGAIAAAFIANLARIYATVLLGQLYGMDYFLINRHWAQGWLFFGLGMAGYFFAIRRIGSTATPIAIVADAIRTPSPVARGRERLMLSAALCGAALLVGPSAVFVLDRGAEVETAIALELPGTAGPWQARPFDGADGFRPEFVGADVKREQTYLRDGASIDLHVARYAYQRQEREAITLNGGYRIAGSWHAMGARTRDLGDGTRVLETEFRSASGARKLVWTWYSVHKQAVTNVYWAKLLIAWAVLQGDPGVAVVVIATDLKDEVHTAEAEAAMHGFLSETRRSIERSIEGA
jgi:EpsI family protein